MQQFSPSSILSVQELLLNLAEFITANVDVSTIDNQLSLMQAIRSTLLNLLHTINGYNIQTALVQELGLLQRINIGAIAGLSIIDQTLIINRIHAVQAFSNQVYPINLWLTVNLNNLNLGQSAIPNFDLTARLIGNSKDIIDPTETPPASLNITNLTSLANEEANAWLQVLQYLATNSPPFQATSYDSADRMYECSSSIASLSTCSVVNDNTLTWQNTGLTAHNQASTPDWIPSINYDVGDLVTPTIKNTGSFTFQALVNGISGSYGNEPVWPQSTNLVLNPTINTTILWNALIAYPTMLQVASILTNDVSIKTSQATNATKFLIIQMLEQVNAIIASFGVAVNIPKPSLATVLDNETLLDFAARTLGDYTQWQAIAQLNGLIPPYIGTVKSIGIAIPGQSLYLPTSSTLSTQQNLDYQTTFLGTDINLGPIGTALETWMGDFDTINGYPNYLYALARRVLTPLGSLIFHKIYGSLIPQSIGSVSTSSEASLLSAYLKKALLSDARTQSVPQIIATPYSFGQILMAALVVPAGINNTLPFNLVIVPETTLKA